MGSAYKLGSMAGYSAWHPQPPITVVITLHLRLTGVLPHVQSPHSLAASKPKSMNSCLSAIATSRTGTIGYVGACYYETRIMPEQLEMYNWVTVLEDSKNMAHVRTL
jgi:hypothetical protein